MTAIGQPTLFLGLGKVTQALGAVIAGPKEALVEREDRVELWRWSEERCGFRKVDERPGRFEEIDWAPWSNWNVFLSPGIDPRREFMKSIGDQEVREFDYVSKNFKGFSVVITGTDGKSTLTFQLGEVLRRVFPDLRMFVGGNLGTAAAEALAESYDIGVFEVSSFQAERLKTASFDLGVLINLAPDHLDRYPDVATYYQTKWRLLTHCRHFCYPSIAAVPAFVRAPSAVAYSDQAPLSQVLKKVAPLATRLIAETLNLHVIFDPRVLENLPRLAHRQQIYRDRDGAIFVDDSKATTVHAMVYAVRTLRSLGKTLKIIVGGRHKGDDFADLKPWVSEKDQIFICGEARDVIAKQLEGVRASLEIYPTLASVFCQQIERVSSDEMLVLSPGCSSYDEFKNFEERGKAFVREVERVRGALTQIVKTDEAD